MPRRFLLGPLALLPWLLLGACGPTAERPAALETRLRFVEPDPQTLLARDELVSAEPLFSWRPRPEGCLAIWPAAGTTAEITLGGRPAHLEWKADRVQIVIPAAAAAAAADRLDVVFRNPAGDNPRTGQVSLLWSDRGEPLSAERRMVQDHGEALADGARRFRFPVGGHRAWDGRVSRLCLIVLPPAGADVALCSIDGLAEELKTERLSELAASGFKAVLGGQTRNALPAFPGLPVERDLEVPRGAVLRFAYALPESARVAVSFRVTAVAVGGGTELFRAVLPPEEGGLWREAEVDLAPLAGDRITLRLETSAEGDLEAERALPLWGQPEVLAPR